MQRERERERGSYFHLILLSLQLLRFLFSLFFLSWFVKLEIQTTESVSHNKNVEKQSIKIQIHTHTHIEREFSYFLVRNRAAFFFDLNRSSSTLLCYGSQLCMMFPCRDTFGALTPFSIAIRFWNGPKWQILFSLGLGLFLRCPTDKFYLGPTLGQSHIFMPTNRTTIM